MKFKKLTNKNNSIKFFSESFMKFPFMTLPDETEITHSSIYLEDGVEKIKVYIEQPVANGFFDATCVLPEYKWISVNGFSNSQISEFQNLIEKGIQIIYKFARQGGFGNAANI